MKVLVVVVCFVFFVSVATQKVKRCGKLKVPEGATASCTSGAAVRSRCTFACQEGFKRKSGNRKQTCVCSARGCNWRGKPLVCVPEATKAPVVVTKKPATKEPVQPVAAAKVECQMPDFRRAAYGVVEVSPSGAFLRVSVQPMKTTRRGFTVALVFPKPFPKKATFSAGHVSVERSPNDRILVVRNLAHHKDLSTVGLASFYIQVRNMPNPDPSALTALAGYYNEPVRDVSCILDENEIRPLPTTTPPKTRPTTKATTKVTTKATTKATTKSSTRPTQAPTTKRTTTKRTTTKRTTTKRTTTTLATTQKPAPVADGCEVLSNDGAQAGYLVLNPGWTEGNDYKFTARAQKFGNQGELDDWTMKIEFAEPIDAIEVFIADAEGPYMDGRVWLLRPKSYNQKFQTQLQILMVIKSARITAAPDAVVTFCKDNAEPDVAVTMAPAPTTTTTTTTTAPITTTTARPTTSRATVTTRRPVATTTRAPVNTARCLNSAPHSSLPARSRQTTAFNFKPSQRVRQTKYDYNEVLHLSLLFYEAQRSGPLPSTNRIPFRGDSGLKDGCQVGLDLSKGYYDAGDNVKFGFPMAYTITTVAWGAIEFGEAYQEAGEYERVLDMIKWATDYFIAAHPSPDELYVQVADAGADHSRWERPEDGKRLRRVYKIDASNPGSDVAAETAAALAAASILFTNEDRQYSQLLLRHARELQSFADRHRGAYHNSVPGVDVYYKSWSGYNDELLWALAWLYKATGEDQYLSTLRQQYDRLGGGNTPGEYSWDNKYPGVQVLMADFTGEQRYREHVQRFMTSAQNTATTPMGLTWKIKWGPNRYAANFAAIATFAAKLEPPMRSKDAYLAYAKQQIHYLLGDNERSSSYVVGYGQNPPQRPHHRASSCPQWRSLPVQVCGFDSLNKPTSNPHILFGALVGGPDQSGRYTDDRKDYIANEVATDYNAGFQTAVAGLLFFAMEG